MRIETGTKRQPTRQAILSLLKQSSGLTADQLAHTLGLTTMAVRKHLAALERDGLVETSMIRRRVGRPARLYRLSAQADTLFPTQYAGIARDILTDLAAIDGSAKVELLLARRADRMRAALATALGSTPSFAERVQLLAEQLDDFGYLARCEVLPDGTYRLIQHHCPLRHVAEAFPVACRFELEAYRDVLGAEIERCCYLLDGDGCCAYTIRPRTPVSTGTHRD